MESDKAGYVPDKQAGDRAERSEQILAPKYAEPEEFAKTYSTRQFCYRRRIVPIAKFPVCVIWFPIWTRTDDGLLHPFAEEPWEILSLNEKFNVSAQLNFSGRNDMLSYY